MKLSAAIIAGAALRPQGFQNYFTIDDTSFVCSCALGAAYEGLAGSLPDTFLTGSLDDIILPLIRDRTGIDLCATYIDGEPVLEAILAMNDYHALSREEIAAWLAERGY